MHEMAVRGDPMNFDYTSAHARVIDGVRTARYRALNGSAALSTGVPEVCLRDDKGGAHPADVLWVHAPSGRISPLCKEHMDQWLDNVDEAGDEDPPALIPIRNRRPA